MILKTEGTISQYLIHDKKFKTYDRDGMMEFINLRNPSLSTAENGLKSLAAYSAMAPDAPRVGCISQFPYSHLAAFTNNFTFVSLFIAIEMRKPKCSHSSALKLDGMSIICTLLSLCSPTIVSRGTVILSYTQDFCGYALTVACRTSCRVDCLNQWCHNKYRKRQTEPKLHPRRKVELRGRKQFPVDRKQTQFSSLSVVLTRWPVGTNMKVLLKDKRSAAASCSKWINLLFAGCIAWTGEVEYFVFASGRDRKGGITRHKRRA